MILLQACVHLLCTTNTCVLNRVIRHDIVVGVTFKKIYYYVRVHKKLFFKKCICLALKLRNYYNASFSFQIFYCTRLIEGRMICLNET